jgi:hypothetical protein
MAKIAKISDDNIDPRLGNSSPIGQLLSLGISSKIIEIAQIFGWDTFGETFHKLIWSLCCQAVFLFLFPKRVQGLPEP